MGIGGNEGRGGWSKLILEGIVFRSGLLIHSEVGSALEEELESQGQGRDKDHHLNGKQRHQLKHRELFLSRQMETLPATHIRGKCSVTLLNETESLLSYLNKDDTFFYCLVFDPTHKTLLADKGEIRVGSRYQADATALLKEDESDNRNLEELETLVWTPSHNLTDRQIDQFLVISRSVGTFARALDCSSSVKQPSLHMSAAAASRDITLNNQLGTKPDLSGQQSLPHTHMNLVVTNELCSVSWCRVEHTASECIPQFHAMDTLHKHDYNMAEAISSLVPSTGPVLCRDEMEEWSASEANLFEEALDKYGKDFNDIRQDFLPWKTLKNIIEYYYMWKTTDRYVQQKRVKAVEAESKLKQVYIPNYNKANSSVINNNKGVVNGSSNGEALIGGKACESCNATVSSQWYAWGPTHMQCKLCHNCWLYWKKYGGLKVPSRIGENEIDLKKKSGSVSDEGVAACLRPPRSLVWDLRKVPSLMSPLDRGGGELPEVLRGSWKYGGRVECAEDVVGRKGALDDVVYLVSVAFLFFFPPLLPLPLEGVMGSLVMECGRQPAKGATSEEFKLKAQLARHYATAHGLAIRSGSPRPIMKTRTAFYLCTTPLTRISRRLCRHLIQPRHAARAPFWPINIPSVKQECTYYITYSQLHMAGKSVLELRELLRYRKKERGSVTLIANRLGQPNLITPEWLILTPKDMMPLPEHVSFPKPPKAPDGTLLYERVPNKPEAEKAALNNISPTLLKRRAYEEVNGMDGLKVLVVGTSMDGYRLVWVFVTRVGRKQVGECVPSTLVAVEQKDVPATLVAVEQKDVPATLVAVERKDVPATLVAVERKDVPATLVAVERKDVPATLVAVERKDVPATLVAVERKDVPATLVAVERKDVPATLVAVERKDVPATLVAVERKDVPATLVAVERKDVPATLVALEHEEVPAILENMDCGAVQAVERVGGAGCASAEERDKGRLNSEAQQVDISSLVVPQPGPPAKRAHKDPGPMRAPDSFSAMLGRPVINHLNGKTKIATMTRSGSGRKQVISWMDAPDDVYFRSTDGTKKMRRQLTGTELRRAARKPWRKLNTKCMVDNLLVILD
uniref:Metastasis-associated protein MTA3 n=1 Tax=Timema genevievae TaxID=629358 RepID=A0A7R9K2L4_TIMGE|nr:unnamed protein product [Timema genevievae]